MMIVGGIVLYGPVALWVYLSGSALAFTLLNFVSIMYDSDCPLPKMNELATWLAILTSWISALALFVIAVPLTFIALRDSTKQMWNEIVNHSLFRE